MHPVNELYGGLLFLNIFLTQKEKPVAFCYRLSLRYIHCRIFTNHLYNRFHNRTNPGLHAFGSYRRHPEPIGFKAFQV